MTEFKSLNKSMSERERLVFTGGASSADGGAVQ